jgi:hypothetical protein
VLVDAHSAAWPQQPPDLRKRIAQVGNVVKRQVCDAASNGPGSENSSRAANPGR